MSSATFRSINPTDPGDLRFSRLHRLTDVLLQIFEIADDHLPVLVRARQHDRALDYRDGVAREFQRIDAASVRLLSHGAIEMVFKLQSHFIEARGQPPPKRGVR